ncbi:MAG: 50S ribosomal protein L18e [Thermoplasmata archaeon]
MATSIRMAKLLTKTNPGLVALIGDLKQAARENDAPIWRDLAKRLSRASSRWAEVNLSRLERYSAKGDILVVPGKLLGSGQISKPIKVAAFRTSKTAREKVEAAGGEVLEFRQLMREYPKGSGVRIMG